MASSFYRFTSIFTILALIAGNFVIFPRVVDAGQWVNVGEPGFTDGQAPESFMIDSSDVPYIAYTNETNGFKATVMKFNGSEWEAVGLSGFSSGQASYLTLDIDTLDTPYVAFADEDNSSKATVMKFNGSEWELVGTAGFSDGLSYNIDLAIDSSDTPYVAYTDDAHSNKATVMKFNGDSWELVGTAGFSSGGASFPTLGFGSSDTPYLGFSDSTQNGKATVMKFNGDSWELVGSAGFTSQTVYGFSFYINSSDVPYIIYRSDQNLVRVWSYSGSWNSLVGIGSGSNGNIVLDSTNVPYIVYTDYSFDSKASVKKFNGSSWELIGTAGFSSGVASASFLDIDSTDTVYVAIMDDDYGNKATVMKFDTVTQFPPQATNVIITGFQAVGGTLHGSYDFSDSNDDTEEGSMYQWYRDGEAIEGETAITYTITEEDVDTEIQFEVTPVSDTAPQTGTSVMSDPVIPVLGNTYTVNTLLDDGDGSCTEEYCSFRDAVATAGDWDTINFSVTGDLVLTQQSTITVDDNISIDGPGEGVLTIDFDGSSNDIYLQNTGTVVISDLTFANSSSYVLNSGSAGSTYYISNVTFSENSEYEPIYAEYGDWNFDDVTFSNNIGTDYSGAIYFNGSDSGDNLNITNSAFSNNTSAGYGTIYVDGGIVNITNSTFVDNDDNGSDSSGIYNDGEEINITNSTFYNNISNSGTIYNNGGNINIVNSIIYGSNNCDGNTITSLGHNIDSGTSCGFAEEGDLSETDPLLDPEGLKDNGGPVQTIALLAGSPAINAGDDEQAPDTDARGYGRLGISDIGAFEYNGIDPDAEEVVEDSSNSPRRSRSGGFSPSITNPAQVIANLKSQIVTLITQLIVLLQAEIYTISAPSSNS